MSKETILVTGASGFIGGWLAEFLYLDGSINVRAGIRSWSSAARLARFPMEITLCNVMDTEQITQAITGTTCIIHTAYGSNEVTIQGTKNMLTCALRLGVQRFIHLSTTEVYGNVNGKIDETYPYHYSGNPYGDSKIEAEKLCWEYYSRGLPITIFRPSIVYGPFGRTWTIELASKLQSGNWNTLTGYGEGICNLIYIEDLVSGILLASRNLIASGEAFNLCGPEALTWNEYFQRYATALRLPPLKIKTPETTRFHALGMEPIRNVAKFSMDHYGNQIKSIGNRFAMVKNTLRSSEKYIKTVPRLADLNLFSREALYVTTKANKLFGFNPLFDVEAGLELTVRWLEHVGYLDKAA